MNELNVTDIIASFIITWSIGLIPPLLIRYVILKIPMKIGYAIGTCALFWVINIVIFTALGSQSKTHGAIHLIAIASYFIFRKRDITQRPNSLKAPLSGNDAARATQHYVTPRPTTKSNTKIISIGLIFFVILGSVVLVSILKENDKKEGAQLVPPLKSLVTDLTSTLSSDERVVLEQKLAEFDGRKGAQIAVLIVPTTQPETIEQYASRVSEAWRLGRKSANDGVLLLLAKNDHQLRIEVDHGLERVLNDATAKRIIEDIIVPKFRRGDFFSGISGGVATIIAQLEVKDVASPALAPRNTQPLVGGDSRR